ncbi:MAG: TIGR03915 family putative DNA repair protein [Lachnospiraceae bacterium]|jgi:hypothetical protein|nr:TIGR03915 family putative DNA repair protein [Lachnospiraceae bacterium]
MELYLICEDSLEGIFAAIYEAYLSKRPRSEVHLQIGEEENLRLFAEYRHVRADPELAAKVAATVRKCLGDDGYMSICYALAATAADKGEAVFRVITAAFDGERSSPKKENLTSSHVHSSPNEENLASSHVHSSPNEENPTNSHVHSSLKKENFTNSHIHSSPIMENLTNPHVMRVFELARACGRETHALLGFIRFSELENGLLYAPIGPKSNILTFMMPHFAERMPEENFVIHDEKRGLFGVHPAGGEWFAVTGDEGISLSRADFSFSTQEAHYRELFITFFHSIAIDERRNNRSQRGHLPLRYREYMVEFTER